MFKILYCTSLRCLKISVRTLELLHDVDKIMFIETDIRGRISQCSNRYGKANHVYMEHEYNKNSPSSFLIYFDVNNLYGTAMTEYLPVSNFQWIYSIHFYTENVINTPNGSDVGYILEIDLEYPIELHNHHKDLTLCLNI